MDKKRALIHHEILNLMTIIDFTVSAADLKEEDKEEILRQLKLVTLLIKYEEIFLNREKEVLKRPVYLNEILETLVMMHGKQLKRKKVSVKIFNDDTIIKTDRKMAQEALEQILDELMGHAENVAVACQNGTLSIEYDPPRRLADKKTDLMKCFTDRKACPDFAYQLALHLLPLTGAKITSKKGLVKISFK